MPFTRTALALATLALWPTTSACAQTETSDDALYDVHAHRVSSGVLDEDRDIRVVVPRSYGSGIARYPVMYVLDGEANLERAAAVTDHLSRTLRMPEVIVVAVHNTRREADMTPPGVPRIMLPDGEGRADLFLRFFEDELIPFVDERYRSSPFRLLVGHSQGGLLAAYALTTRPKLFTWHVALDAPMGQPEFVTVSADLRDRLAESASHKGRLFSGETSYGWEDEAWEGLEAAASVGFVARRERIEDETHQSMVFAGLHRGLKELFADFPVPATHPQTVEEIDSVFAAATEAYGQPVAPGWRYLLREAGDLLMVRQGTDALAVVGRARALYGDSPRLDELEAEAQAIVREGESDTSLKAVMRELLERPRPTPEEMAPYLGRWVGTALHEGGFPIRLDLSFAVEDGAVVATLTSRTGDMGGTEVLQYVYLTPDGVLEFGYPNRRRPGGLIVSMMEFVGEGALEGVQEVRGIDLARMFPGMEVPVTHVSLERPG